MKAEKITLNIEIQVLSIEVIPGLLGELIRNISEGNIHGTLCKDDGDYLEWVTKKVNVAI